MFCDECASRAYVFECAHRFKEGRRFVYDDERLGEPVTVTTNANFNRLRVLLTTDNCLTTRMLSVELGINCETIRQLLHDKLHMRKLCTKLVPNAPAHSSLAVREYLAEKNIPTLPHSPYSSDLTPCNFFLFTKLKLVLKGMRFDDSEEIEANTTHVLKALTSSNFKSCLKEWERRWNKCVILWGWGGETTVRVLRFSLHKIIKFDHLGKVI